MKSSVKQICLSFILFLFSFLPSTAFSASSGFGVIPLFYKMEAAGNSGQVMYNEQGNAAGSTFTYSRETNRVGLGLANPGYTLDVDGTVDAYYFLTPDGPVGTSTASFWNQVSFPAIPSFPLVSGLDTLVLGNVCLGWDCVAGMDFLSDKLVLRENNLRMFFDSTRSDQGADWQIRINDSADGGDSYFAVYEIPPGLAPDLIEGDPSIVNPFRLSAPTLDNSMYIQAVSGNVGVGTGMPSSTLQVNGYLQAAVSIGMPPVVDCDELRESGRIVMDDATADLWICMDSGWVAK